MHAGTFPILTEVPPYSLCWPITRRIILGGFRREKRPGILKMTIKFGSPTFPFTLSHSILLLLLTEQHESVVVMANGNIADTLVI